MNNVRLIVDRSKNRSEIKDFNQYVQNHIEGLMPLNTAFHIEHLNSQEDYGLQAVDLFCWGIYRKFEFNDDDWFKVYEKKLRYLKEYLPRTGA